MILGHNKIPTTIMHKAPITMPENIKPIAAKHIKAKKIQRTIILNYKFTKEVKLKANKIHIIAEINCPQITLIKANNTNKIAIALFI